MIIDHIQGAKDRLPSHMDGAANMALFWEIVGKQFNDIEAEQDNLLLLRSVLLGVGAQLDGIGQIVDLARTVGQTDASYRTALLGRTAELSKSGEVEALIVSYKALTSAASVTAADNYPAGVQLTANTNTDPEDPLQDADTIVAMNLVKAGGIDLTLSIGLDTGSLTLSDISEADGNQNGPQSATEGLGDEILTDGGGLTRIL